MAREDQTDPSNISALPIPHEHSKRLLSDNQHHMNLKKKNMFNPEGNEYAKTSTESASCSPFCSYITGKVHITSALSHFELAFQEIENLHLSCGFLPL